METDDKKSKYHKSYAPLKKLFGYLGLEGMKNEKSAAIFARKYWWSLFQYVLYQPIMIQELVMFIRTIAIDQDLKKFVATSACMITCFLASFKIIAIIVHPRYLHDLNRELFKLWPEEPHSERLKAIIDKPLASLSTICHMLIFAFIIVVSIFHLVPFVVMPYFYFIGEPVTLILPWPTWYPYGIEQNIYLYILFYIHHILCGNFVGVAIGACDSYLAFCITHITIQFEILYSDLINIVEVHHHKYTPDEEPYDWNGAISKDMPYDKYDYKIPHQDELYKSLSDIIKRHNVLIM